jgi:hypothetical protein
MRFSGAGGAQIGSKCLNYRHLAYEGEDPEQGIQTGGTGIVTYTNREPERSFRD